jgi:hypothetical protein
VSADTVADPADTVGLGIYRGTIVVIAITVLHWIAFDYDLLTSPSDSRLHVAHDPSPYPPCSVLLPTTVIFRNYMSGKEHSVG